MKGMVFTELFELVEEKFGYDLLDDVIDESNLTNDGAYTAVGNYEFDELLRFVVNLSKRTNVAIPDLLELYGEYLFPKLIKFLPQFDTDTNIIDFIASVETHIHVEVKKLYPDAELPTFEIISKDDKSISFYYVSKRGLHDLAKGMLKGASAHFNSPVDIDVKSDDKGVLISIVQKS